MGRGGPRGEEKMYGDWSGVLVTLISLLAACAAALLSLTVVGALVVHAGAPSESVFVTLPVAALAYFVMRGLVK